jgi:hypothetical protein
MAASADSNTQINVSATVKPVPQANLTVNFDGLNFVGTVGDAAVPATYTKNGAAGSNTVEVTARGFYTLMVSGGNLFTAPVPNMPAPMVNLDSRRLKVTTPVTGAQVALQPQPTIIDQGANGTPGSVLKTQKALDFTLDLSRPEFNPQTGMANYSDADFFQLEQQQTNLFANVTISFTSM